MRPFSIVAPREGGGRYRRWRKAASGPRLRGGDVLFYGDGLKVDPRRDRFQFAQPFLEVGDLDPRSGVRDRRVLRQRRVARGVRVTLPDFGVASMIVFAAEPVVLRSLHEGIARTAERAARLQQDLAQMKLMRVEQLQQQMTALQASHAHGPQYVALARQALHAAELGFIHPVTKHRLSFQSAMPPDMQELFSALGV